MKSIYNLSWEILKFHVNKKNNRCLIWWLYTRNQNKPVYWPLGNSHWPQYRGVCGRPAPWLCHSQRERQHGYPHEGDPAIVSRLYQGHSDSTADVPQGGLENLGLGQGPGQWTDLSKLGGMPDQSRGWHSLYGAR